ncbi:MAG: phospholipid/cholesterol/gamma-HCH transport system substrate-binding protein [Acidimicrobiaceae bacterium]|jgi:phospholipid/cholesterol/gamma-HCH transport system substrate-binding protein|nr:phospholipid/cholesterol/gamma-HCH transport system substrate-binding protein [Acidimicrobiaceae bacterium]
MKTMTGEKGRPGTQRRPVLPFKRAAGRAKRLAASSLATLLLAALLTSCSFGGTASDHLVAIFRNTVSLYSQNEVKVLGMTVGHVQSLKVINDNQVRVSFSVRKDVPLPRDVKAVIVPQSLLGARYVQLFPAWVQGQPRLDPAAADQRIIPVDRTSVPVEPDEALSAVNDLLKSLDPQATGKLITNLNDDLTGNGQNVNDAIRSLAGITNTLADKDQQLVALIDNLQQFTTVLDTRESQLGQVMDLFAQTTSLLAQERGTIASLITSLASVSTNALDLVTKHAAPLQEDIKSLSDLVQTLDGNLNNVSTLLSSLPQLVAGPNLDGKAGFVAAYNPTYHRIDLRDSLGSTVNGLLQALGLPLCLAIPLLDVLPQCAPGSIQLPLGQTPAPAAGAAAPVAPAAGAGPAAKANGPAGSAARTTPTTKAPATGKKALDATPQPASPLAAVLSLIGSGSAAAPQVAGYGMVASAPPAPQRGPVATLAGWAHDALGELW